MSIIVNKLIWLVCGQYVVGMWSVMAVGMMALVELDLILLPIPTFNIAIANCFSCDKKLAGQEVRELFGNLNQGFL